MLSSWLCRFHGKKILPEHLEHSQAIYPSKPIPKFATCILLTILIMQMMHEAQHLRVERPKHKEEVRWYPMFSGYLGLTFFPCLWSSSMVRDGTPSFGWLFAAMPYPLGERNPRKAEVFGGGYLETQADPCKKDYYKNRRDPITSWKSISKINVIFLPSSSPLFRNEKQKRMLEACEEAPLLSQ